MPPSPERQISSEMAFSCPWWNIRHDRYYTNDSKTRSADYFYIQTSGSVMIVPMHSDGSIEFISQYRYLEDAIKIELPGGGIGKDISALDAAKRELKEETGFTARIFEQIGSFTVMSGLVDEIATVFLARNLYQGSQQLETTEYIKTIRIPLREIDQLIEQGKISDGMTLAALCLARQNLSKLKSDALL